MQDKLRRIDGTLVAGAQVSPKLLADIPFDIYAALQLERPAELPNLVQTFPRLPPVAIQEGWVGASGRPLLIQSVQFIRSLARAFERHGRVPLSEARVLDYGCGWGRLLQLLPYFVPERQLFGVDAWPSILETARSLGVRAALVAIDEYPERLALNEPMDLVYAFSVFTNLSERALHCALSAIHRALAPGGVLIATIRPIDFWTHCNHPHAAAMIEAHRSHGIAFTPHGSGDAGQDMPYGDTSIALEYIERTWKDFQIVELDHNLVDPMQLIVTLRANPAK